LALLASQTTVLNGDLEPVWSPPTTTVAATTNEDESPAATDVSTTNTTMPITWETDWENVVHDLRGDEELYTYFLANLGGRVAGVSQWNFNSLTGAKPPSEVMSVLMEALLPSIIPPQLREGVGVAAVISADPCRASPWQASLCTPSRTTAALRMAGV
jgi:hypothetical protein